MKFNLITLFIILCLGFTSCSENETPEPRTTRTILVYMMANNSLNSFASKNIESMIEGATSKNLNGGNLIVYYAPAGSPPELLRIKEENGVVKKIHLKDYEKQNSADPDVMRSVISEVVSQYPADSYGLVLWSHGENLNSSIEEADMASRLANVNHLLSEEAAAAIKKYPDEEASVVLIQHYFNHPDDTRQMDELLAVLNPKLNDFYLVRKLQEYSTRAKRTALGAEAPGFNVKNIYGTPVSLDSFPKKYLLLAFTAPWCDMCQTEDLYLDEVAMKYPKEKVDMLLVSLDDDQAEVRKVLAKDSIGWNLVTDSAGQAAMLVDLYNVSALPRCFLIDEEGKIILKTDNGVEIKQTLEKLME